MAWRLTNVAEEWHFNMTMAAWAKGKFTNCCKESVLSEFVTNALSVVIDLIRVKVKIQWNNSDVLVVGWEMYQSWNESI
jgi:hypothetical protein